MRVDRQKGETENDVKKEDKTDRQTDGQTDRQTDRQTGRQTERIERGRGKQAKERGPERKIKLLYMCVSLHKLIEKN